MSTRYQITLQVTDKPGVLAQVAGLFSEHGVSVEAVQQTVASAAPGRSPGEALTATLVIVTHEAPEAALSATVAAVSSNDAVVRVESVLRVEGDTP